ncbi:MAG: hypothetical protein U9Q07_08740, partial [Planctomycetota bacterium]|nr:hypothetical protein [Planctomycetota bacterium]
FRRYGPDEAMVAAIQAASPTIGAMITDFGGDGGLDFSTDDVRDAIDALVSSVSALTVVHGANLKALGWRTISRAEELGLGDIYIGHVQKARAA